MRYRFLPAVLLLLMPIVSTRTASARIPAVSYLTVSPRQGHPGAAFFVSGGDFKPHTREVLTIACPDVLAARPGAISIVPGPKTDAHGRFVHFMMHAPVPPKLRHPLHCTVYASIGRKQFGPDIKGRFILLPARNHA